VKGRGENRWRISSRKDQPRQKGKGAGGHGRKSIYKREEKEWIRVMKTLTFNFHNEQEEKVLLAFLNSLQYDYRPVEEPEAFQFSQEEIKGLLQTKQDFLEGKTAARPWEEIKQNLKLA
jgi:hypothetical protein